MIPAPWSAAGSMGAFMMLFLVTGCAHWTTILKAPPPATSMTVSGVPPAPLVIESVSGTLNGNPTPANSTFVESYASGMRQTGLFTPVFEPSVAHQAPPDALRMTINVAESIDTHQGAAFVKGFFIGLTFFLLEPVLPLNSDAEQQIEATLRLPDGRVRQYSAETMARLSFHLLANSVLAGAELASKVGTSNVQAIMARIREDEELRSYLQARVNPR